MRRYFLKSTAGIIAQVTTQQCLLFLTPSCINMETDLRLSDKQYLICLTVFFFSYTIFEVLFFALTPNISNANPSARLSRCHRIYSWSGFGHPFGSRLPCSAGELWWRVDTVHALCCPHANIIRQYRVCCITMVDCLVCDFSSQRQAMCTFLPFSWSVLIGLSCRNVMDARHVRSRSLPRSRLLTVLVRQIIVHSGLTFPPFRFYPSYPRTNYNSLFQLFISIGIHLFS